MDAERARRPRPHLWVGLGDPPGRPRVRGGARRFPDRLRARSRPAGHRGPGGGGHHRRRGRGRPARHGPGRRARPGRSAAHRAHRALRRGRGPRDRRHRDRPAPGRGRGVGRRARHAAAAAPGPAGWRARHGRRPVLRPGPGGRGARVLLGRDEREHATGGGRRPGLALRAPRGGQGRPRRSARRRRLVAPDVPAARARGRAPRRVLAPGRGRGARDGAHRRRGGRPVRHRAAGLRQPGAVHLVHGRGAHRLDHAAGADPGPAADRVAAGPAVDGGDGGSRGGLPAGGPAAAPPRRRLAGPPDPAVAARPAGRAGGHQLRPGRLRPRPVQHPHGPAHEHEHGRAPAAGPGGPRDTGPARAPAPSGRVPGGTGVAPVGTAHTVLARAHPPGRGGGPVHRQPHGLLLLAAVRRGADHPLRARGDVRALPAQRVRVRLLAHRHRPRRPAHALPPAPDHPAGHHGLPRLLRGDPHGLHDPPAAGLVRDGLRRPRLGRGPARRPAPRRRARVGHRRGADGRPVGAGDRALGPRRLPGGAAS